jgi:hypothetical protein
LFLLNWLKQYLEIKSEYKASQKELKFCESCEVLKLQLSIANEEKKALLNRLLDKPEVEEKPAADPRELRPINMSKYNNWNVRRQALEREDRERAKILEQNKKNIEPDTNTRELTTEEIEKELGVVNASE